jgi:hypothetical protein
MGCNAVALEHYVALASCAYCRGPTPRQPQLVWTTDFAESDEFGELALIDVC